MEAKEGMGLLLSRETPTQFLNEDERLEKRARRAKPIVIMSSKFKTFEPNNKVEGQSWRTMNIMSKGLGLDIQVINQLYSLFCIADLDKGGTIDVYEFLYFMKLEDSPFSRKMFSLFDSDKSNEIDLLEFVCAVWNLATWAEDELGKMMFYLYDEDNSGFLELEECRQLIADVYGARSDKTEQEILVDSLSNIAVKGVYADEDRVYFADFMGWLEINDEALLSLRCMYQIVRKSILGHEYWDTIGVNARKQTLDALLGIVRDILGPPGAQEAVARALARANKRKEKEVQRRRNEKLWGNVSIEDSFDERQKLLRKKEDEARHRANAVNYLHGERNKRVHEWYKTRDKIMGQGDPLSVILRFSNREFLSDLRAEFEGHWQRAMVTLQDKMYDREGRLETLVGLKAPKSEVYAQRKQPQSLGAEERRDSNILYSSAVGKLTWVEQRHSRKKSLQKDLRHAGGNLHLASMAKTRKSNGSADGEDNQDDDSDYDSDSGSSSSDASISSDDDEYQVVKGWRKKKRTTTVPGVDVDINVATSTCKAAGRRQYPIQNAKRPPIEWRKKQIEHLKQVESGEIFSKEKSKPYFTYRGKGRKSKVYVSSNVTQ